MADNEIQQIDSTSLRMENLPDGSTAVFDMATQSIHSLDPLAAAAFTACSNKKTLHQLIEAISQISGMPITEVVAPECDFRIGAGGTCRVLPFNTIGNGKRLAPISIKSGGRCDATGFVAHELGTERRFAQRAGSGILATTTTTVAPTATTTTAGPTSTTTTTTTTRGPVTSIVSAVQYGSANVGLLSVNQSVPQLFLITGENTHFNASSVVSFSTAGISGNVEAIAPTAHQVRITVAPGVAVGTTSISVTTGTEVAVGKNIPSLVLRP